MKDVETDNMRPPDDEADYYYEEEEDGDWDKGFEPDDSELGELVDNQVKALKEDEVIHGED